MWKSKEVQDALTQLMKETPGSAEWNNKGAELIVEYQDQLEKINEERSKSDETPFTPFNLVAHVDSLMAELKSGGALYEGEIGPQER